MKNLFFATVFLCGALSAHALQKVPGYQVSVDDDAEGSGLVFDAQSNPEADSPAGTLQRFIDNLEVDETILRKSELESEFNATFPDIVPTIENSLSTNVTTTTSDPGEAGDVTVTGRDLEISFPNDYKTVEEVVVENENPGVGEVEFTNQTLTVTFPQVLTNIVVGEDAEDGSVEYDAGTLTVEFPTEKGVTNLTVDTNAETNNASLEGNELTIEFVPPAVIPPIVYAIEGFIPKKLNIDDITLSPGRGSVQGNFFYSGVSVFIELDTSDLPSAFGFKYVYVSSSITNKLGYNVNPIVEPTDIRVSSVPPAYNAFYGQWYASATDPSAVDGQTITKTLQTSDVLVALFHSPDNEQTVGNFYAFRGNSKSTINYFMSQNFDASGTQQTSKPGPDFRNEINHHDLSFFFDYTQNYGQAFNVEEIVQEGGTDLASGKTPRLNRWYEPITQLSSFTPVNAFRACLGLEVALDNYHSLLFGIKAAEVVDDNALNFDVNTAPWREENSNYIDQNYDTTSGDGGDQFSLFDGSGGHTFIFHQDSYDQNFNDRNRHAQNFWIDLAPSRHVKMTFGDVGYNRDPLLRFFRLTAEGFEFAR